MQGQHSSLASIIGHTHSYLILRRGQKTRTQWVHAQGLGNVLLPHTRARFISSGNLAPIVEMQPRSGYHRNRSNGSLMFVRVASLLVRHGRQISALFKDRLLVMINPSEAHQIK